MSLSSEPLTPEKIEEIIKREGGECGEEKI